VQTTSFFSGLSADERDLVLSRLSPRRFPAESILLAEGDGPSLMYAILDGTADILIHDRGGKLHRITSVGKGDTVGEMSLLTGDPVSATVRATSDIEVMMLTEVDLERALELFPALYRNLGAILSERLAQSNRRILRERAGVVTTLIDRGAPPILGYALACSVAWHARKSTVLLRVADGDVPDALAALGSSMDAPDSFPIPGFSARHDPAPGARLFFATTTGAFAPERRDLTIQLLRESFDYVILQYAGIEPPESPATRTLMLVSTGTTIPRLTSGGNWSTIQAWDGSSKLFGANTSGVLRVPELTSHDERAIATGRLPNSSHAGGALGWAARDLTRLKVGLALGAGSIKGYAHVGVLRALERLGLPIDCLAGTSVGAAVGATYALGHSPEQVAEMLDNVGGSAFRLKLPTSSVLSMSGVRDGVQRVGGNSRFEDLPKPLGIVAADIASGSEVIFTRGLLWPAVLASMAIPGIYPPQRIGDHLLVDGGVLNPVPSSVAAGLGADMVIAVKLASRNVSEPLDIEGEEIGGKSISVVQAIMRAIEMMQGKIVTDTANAATILIEPDFGSLSGWGLRSFKQGRRYIEAGEAAAEAALPRLAATLPWLRS
jgi:NTE family protein